VKARDNDGRNWVHVLNMYETCTHETHVTRDVMLTITKIHLQTARKCVWDPSNPTATPGSR
jgi:hypothetical protein